MDLDDDDQCGFTLAGCAAVAMAQIMYKWGYPEKSKYNSYNWDRIPPVLTDGCSYDCPQLIRDCGTACNMHYQTFAGIYITGSWAVPSKVAEGFSDFDYSAHLVDLKDWRFGSAWADLIRSEIDCGRPVLMHGQKNVIDIKDRHYFVIDGYSKEDKDQFHVNWGWRGKNNGYYDLQSCGYSNGQDIIIGIAPKHTGTSHPRITFAQKTEVLTPDCPDGINDKIRYEVHNADSYECHVFDRSGKKIWACAGLVKDGYADMWDCSSNTPLPSADYWYVATFKNNFGDRVEHEGHVTLLHTKCPPGYDPTSNESTQESTDLLQIASDATKPVISPNPTNGHTQITANAIIHRIDVMDMDGRVLLSESPVSKDCIIDVSGLIHGIYIIRVVTDEGASVDRLIVK
ncbi:MAG: C10 family peptidase [Paludibacteraceae bacterium]|nr:C10 family peptidase [Paludibacteraceae bacterium]